MSLSKWWELAACRDMGIAVFFPERTVRRGVDRVYDSQVAAAKDVCARCVVKGACLEDALAEFGTGGIRGGLTERERDALPHVRRRPLVAVCGTTGGYYRHLAQRTGPCDACRKAHSTAERRRNAARAASVPPHPRHGAIG